MQKVWPLFKFHLRRDWIKLTIWFFGLLYFSGGLVQPVYEVYGKDAKGLAGLYETLQNPAMIALCGPTAVQNAESYTIQAMYAQEMILFTALLFAIIAIQHAISKTRRQEDDGILELLQASTVGKMANTAAICLQQLLFHVLLGLGIALVIQLQGISGFENFRDNLAFGFSLSMQGLIFGAIALFYCQIATNASQARALSFTTLGGLYILRMGTDIQNVHLSWLNPLSWSYLSDVYVKTNALVFVLGGIFIAIVGACALLLEKRRDMFAGLLPEKEGRGVGGRLLRSIGGLSFRTARGYHIGWLFALFILGATYGSIFGDMDKFLESNDMFKQILAANPKYSVQESFLGILFMILSIFVAVYASAFFMRLVGEEKKGRFEQVYAMPITRSKLFCTYYIHTIAALILGQFAGVAGVYLAQSAVMKHPIAFATIAHSGFAWTGATFIYVSITAVGIGVFPRLLHLIWGYFGLTYAIGYLGELIKVPEWLKAINVLDHVSHLPLEKMDWGEFGILIFIGLLLSTKGWFFYRRRDLL
ncbi:MAG: hypothetical protein LBD38_02825 [Streptococcaceae bacterium]|jgi:ABC-2 type transport system permease protein|nr:hypothetical protein [Streptococcaceae bacterium]